MPVPSCAGREVNARQDGPVRRPKAAEADTPASPAPLGHGEDGEVLDPARLRVHQGAHGGYGRATRQRVVTSVGGPESMRALRQHLSP